MGIYINPKNNVSQEAWLEEHGRVVAFSVRSKDPNVLFNDLLETDDLLICLVNNVIFSAAVVCYNASEIAEFAKSDGRAKSWFVVNKSDLNEDAISKSDVEFLNKILAK